MAKDKKGHLTIYVFLNQDIGHDIGRHIGTVLDSYLGPYTSHMVLNRVPVYLRMFSYSNFGPIRPEYGPDVTLDLVPYILVEENL